MVTAPRGQWVRFTGWLLLFGVVVIILINLVSFFGLNTSLNCQVNYNRHMAAALGALHGIADQQASAQAHISHVVQEYSSNSPQVKAARSAYALQQDQIVKARKAHPLPRYTCG